MSKYNPFETTEEMVHRHFIVGLVIITLTILTVFACLLLWIEQHHEMERVTNKELYGKAN